MSIAGYETRELVLVQLAALEREAAGHTWDERHRAEIRAQIKIFKNALKEIEAAGPPIEDRHRGRPTLIRNATSGQTYIGGWIN